MRADRVRLLGLLAEPGLVLTMSGADLDLALRQLRRLKLLARLGLALQEQQLLESLPVLVQDQFVSAINMAAARARLARWELDRMARVLRPGREFPVVVLKGSSYLLLDVPFATGRMLADVDLLVPEESLRDTELALRGAGWESAPLTQYDERYYRDWAHEIPPLRHVEREIEVDIHHNIVMRTARLKPQARLLLDEAQPAGDQGYSTLSPPDLVLHAMTHLFCSSEQQDALRELVDIDALLRHFAAQSHDFWLRLLHRARELDLQRPAWYALHYCSGWLRTPVPESVLTGIRAIAPPLPARLLMDWLVPGALFARHPDQADHFAGFSRAVLLARSHWIRMPPAQLVAHLSRKLLRRVTSRKEPPS